MITIHRQLKYVIFFALGLFLGSTAFASAYTYERTPTGIVSSDTFTISYTATTQSETCPTFPPLFGFGNPVQYRTNLWYRHPQDGLMVALSDSWKPISQLSFTTIFQGIETRDIEQVKIECDYQNVTGMEGAFVESDGNGGVIFTITQYTTPPTPTTTPTTTIVSGAFSFVDFNDVSPTDMVASVRQGTVETTGKTLPLLVFLGIPLAFLLLVMVSKLINNTVAPQKKGNGRGWTAHGAMEHDLTAFKKKERSRLKRNLE